MPQAAKRIQATLEWRAQVHPETMTCTACQQLPKSHYMHLVGFDLLDRPVMYSCLEMITNRSIEDNWRHMISCFEQVLQQNLHLQAAEKLDAFWCCMAVTPLLNLSSTR